MSSREKSRLKNVKDSSSFWEENANISLFFSMSQGFPGDSEGKASACNVGELGLIPRSGRSPGEGNGNLLQYSCWKIPWMEGPGRLYSPWDRQELHTTEPLHFSRIRWLATSCCKVMRQYVPPNHGKNRYYQYILIYIGICTLIINIWVFLFSNLWLYLQY